MSVGYETVQYETPADLRVEALRQALEFHRMGETQHRCTALDVARSAKVFERFLGEGRAA